MLRGRSAVIFSCIFSPVFEGFVEHKVTTGEVLCLLHFPLSIPFFAEYFAFRPSIKFRQCSTHTHTHTRLIRLLERLYIAFATQNLQPTQLVNRSACLSLRESKCSKWRNSDIINTCHYYYYLYYFPMLTYTDLCDVWMRL